MLSFYTVWFLTWQAEGSTFLILRKKCHEPDRSPLISSAFLEKESRRRDNETLRQGQGHTGPNQGTLNTKNASFLWTQRGKLRGFIKGEISLHSESFRLPTRIKTSIQIRSSKTTSTKSNRFWRFSMLAVPAGEQYSETYFHPLGLVSFNSNRQKHLHR